MSSTAAGGLVHARSTTRAMEQAMTNFTACPPCWSGRRHAPGSTGSILTRQRREGRYLCGRTDRPLSGRLPKIPRAEIVAADQSVHGRAAHRQQAGGLRDIPARFDERFHQGTPLRPVARLSEGRGGAILDVDAEVANFNDLAAGHQDRPLDGVLELADVAGPGMVDDGLERRAAEAELAPVRLAAPLEQRVGDDHDV